MKPIRQDPSTHAALRSALEALPLPSTGLPLAGVAVSEAQWSRSVADAEPDTRLEKYREARQRVVDAIGSTGSSIGRKLRPAAIAFAAAAVDLCQSLELLAALDPGDVAAPKSVETHRSLMAQDARMVLGAALASEPPPILTQEPALSEPPVQEDCDVLLETFEIPSDALADDQGRFCDTRVIAHYRLRLGALQQKCDPIMSLVCDRPPSVFTAVSAVRDIVTSTSPWLTLWAAREIRARLLSAFDENPSRTKKVLADASREADKEDLAFERLIDRIRRAEQAMTEPNGTERDKAVNLFEAYKYMAEGLSRRWVGVLLALSGVKGSTPTLGAMGPLAAERLGSMGARLQAALSPAIRNAEAHDDFVFDDDTGMLIAADVQIDPEDILAQLTELDVLQRAFIIGRLGAFTDNPGLGTEHFDARQESSASSDLFMARMRFGHAGQRLTSFVRDRDRIDIVLDELRAESSNPCFLALTQAAQILPTVGRFVVRVKPRDDPVIDLPSSVLRENFHVLKMAMSDFSDGLPPVTFLPALTWARLACEPLDQAGRAAGWIALNDALSAVLDAKANPAEIPRLSQRYLLVAGAITCTIRIFPEVPHVDGLIRARQVMRAALNTFVFGDPYGVLTDRIQGVRDQLGSSPPPILPTLDPDPPPERVYPPEVS